MPRLAVLVLTAAVTAGCRLAESVVPPLTGPSSLALALVVAAVPDTLYEDGVSTSSITLAARDAAGRPMAGATFTVDVATADSASPGRLSSRIVATGPDGQAVVVYTAPRGRAVVPRPTADRTVTITFTPIGTEAGAVPARSVRLRLRPV
jgi:hypothetical protein